MMENLLDFIVGSGGGDGVGRCMVSFIQNILHYSHTHTHVVVVSHMLTNKFITFNFRAKRFPLVGHRAMLDAQFFFLVLFLFIHFSITKKGGESELLFHFPKSHLVSVNISTFNAEYHHHHQHHYNPKQKLNFGWLSIQKYFILFTLQHV